MYRARIMFLTLFIACLALAVVCWVGSNMEYATVKQWLDSESGDGDVESYTARFHARALGNFRVFAWIFTALSAGLLMVRRWLMEAGEKSTGAWGTFRADYRHGIHKLGKGTSAAHKRWVWLIIAIGAGLRIAMLWEPVIYDEAFTYTYYATRPLGVILSDYSYPNNHILNTLLIKLCCALFGVGQVQIRLPALLAGIACMPLFYAFVRAMFNRYIALIALAFIASSGPLVEYSALARGYSLTWLFMIIGLMLGRYFAKSNNTVSAILIAVVNALGMWAVPTMIYASLAIYIWIGLYLVTSYDSSLQRRTQKLALSAVLFMALVFLMYLPVIMVYGFSQLFYHPTMGDNSWAAFASEHMVHSAELWIHFTSTSAEWISFVGFAGLLYAAYISSKFRLLAVATLLGAVPLVLVQSMVGPPRTWNYTLFVLHLSSAIALFYMLKAVQEYVYTGFSKRLRTVITSLVVLSGMGWLGMRAITRNDRIERYVDARSAVNFMVQRLKPDDRVMTDYPWEPAVKFYLLANGVDEEVLYRQPGAGADLYIVVSPADEQTPESVMEHNRWPGEMATSPVKLKDWKRLEIFAARTRTP